MDNCPKCGEEVASELASHTQWGCDSLQIHGQPFSQSDRCRVGELEAEKRSVCQHVVGRDECEDVADVVKDIVTERLDALNELDRFRQQQGTLRQELTDAKAAITANTSGETPGDTLIRLSGMIHKVHTGTRAVTTEDWCSWLEDFGVKLNGLYPEAANAKGGDDGN